MVRGLRVGTVSGDEDGVKPHCQHWQNDSPSPAWLNMSLPLEIRRRLLDHAIKNLAGGQQQSETPRK